MTAGPGWDLSCGMYRCIAMDPPWAERGGGKIKRGADRHYPVMSTGEIGKVILRSDAWRPAGDCHLWMWVTNNFLVDGLGLMERLGFRYTTNFVWVKWRDRGADIYKGLQIGLGQYLRGSHELCLFGVRGATMKPPLARMSVLFAERTEHSKKPDDAYRDIIERVSPGPRLEMFARQPREGWDVWGNEVPGAEPLRQEALL